MTISSRSWALGWMLYCSQSRAPRPSPARSSTTARRRNLRCLGSSDIYRSSFALPAVTPGRLRLLGILALLARGQLLDLLEDGVGALFGGGAQQQVADRDARCAGHRHSPTGE